MLAEALAHQQRLPPIVARATRLVFTMDDLRPARALALALLTCCPSVSATPEERAGILAAMEALFHRPDACILDVLSEIADLQQACS